MGDKIVRLKNGGVLIYSKCKMNNSSAVEVGFCVGAFLDKKAGTAHFLEHTLFKKTKNRTNEQVEFDRNKIAFLNASTSMDYIVIKFSRTNKLIEKTIDFSEDILMNSVLDDEFVETEKGVIKEELNMCLDSESRDVYLMNLKQAMSNAKFASDIVGKTEKNIEQIKFKNLQDFKLKHFVGNNFIASVVTPLSIRKIKKFIDKYFTKNIEYDKNYEKSLSYYDQNIIDKDSSLKIQYKKQPNVSVLLSFKINLNEIDIFTKNYNYSFLTKYLSGTQGDLFLKLRNKGLIYRLESNISSFKNESLFNIAFETSKEKIKTILDIIAEEIYKVVNEEISEEITKAYVKNLEYYDDERIPVRPLSKVHLNLMDYLSYGKLFKITNRQKKKLRKGVNSEAVRKVANKIFNKNTKMYISVLGDTEKKYIPTLECLKEKFLISESEL